MRSHDPPDPGSYISWDKGECEQVAEKRHAKGNRGVAAAVSPPAAKCTFPSSFFPLPVAETDVEKEASYLVSTSDQHERVVRLTIQAMLRCCAPDQVMTDGTRQMRRSEPEKYTSAGGTLLTRCLARRHMEQITRSGLGNKRTWCGGTVGHPPLPGQSWR